MAPRHPTTGACLSLNRQESGTRRSMLVESRCACSFLAGSIHTQIQGISFPSVVRVPRASIHVPLRQGIAGLVFFSLMLKAPEVAMRRTA